MSVYKKYQLDFCMICRMTLLKSFLRFEKSALSKPTLGITIKAFCLRSIDGSCTRLCKICFILLLALFLTTAFFENLRLTLRPRKVVLSEGGYNEETFEDRTIIKHDPCFFEPCLLTKSNSFWFFKEKTDTLII